MKNLHLNFETTIGVKSGQQNMMVHFWDHFGGEGEQSKMVDFIAKHSNCSIWGLIKKLYLN